MSARHLTLPPPHVARTPVARCVWMACMAAAGGVANVPALAQSNAAPAPAAAASAPVVEKIVVTARKREEQATDVPISMLVYSDKELRDSGITDVQSLSTSAGFQLQQSTMGSTVASGRMLGTFAFRGLQPATGAPRDNSGSLFIDGIFISGGVSTVNTVGVSRVEVLKGPQNTYFGRSTFGGAVNFITKNPPTSFEGEVNANLTSRGSSDIDATLGGPLGSDTLRGAVTFFNHDKAAPYRASDGGDIGGEKSKGISTTLYATPTDKLWLRLRAQYQEDDDSSAPLAYLRGDVYGNCNGQKYSAQNTDGSPATYTPTVGYFCGKVPSAKQVGIGNVLDDNTAILPYMVPVFVNNSKGDPILSSVPRLDHSGMRRNVTRASAQGAYELPYGATLGFSLGWNDAKSRAIFDLDRSNILNFANALATIADDSTADVRVSSDPAKALRGLFGVSYFSSTYKLTQDDFNVAFGDMTGSVDKNSFDNTKTSVPAVYGSVEYDITSQFTATAEARYQKDKSSTLSFTNVPYSQSFSKLLPRLTLQYKPVTDTNLYTSWSKGVQPTSFNSGYVNASPAQQAYISQLVPGSGIYTPQPEITNIELGIKQSLLQGRLQYSLDAYQINWENQVTFAALFNTPACIAAGTFNTPACPFGASGSGVLLPNNARIRGIEFSGSAFITNAWSVGMNLDLKSAKWTSYYNNYEGGFTGGPTRFNGNYLTRVPKVSGTLNSTYSWALNPKWTGYARADLNYTGDSYADNENIAIIGGYTRVNVHAGARSKDAGVELYAKNLFDDQHWDSGYKLTDLAIPNIASFSRQGVAVYAPDRREIGLRLHLNF